MEVRNRPAVYFGRLQNPEMVRIARGVRHKMLQPAPQSRPVNGHTFATLRYVVTSFFRQLLVRLTEFFVPPTPSERLLNFARKLPFNL